MIKPPKVSHKTTHSAAKQDTAKVEAIISARVRALSTRKVTEAVESEGFPFKDGELKKEKLLKDFSTGLHIVAEMIIKSDDAEIDMDKLLETLLIGESLIWFSTLTEDKQSRIINAW